MEMKRALTAIFAVILLAGCAAGDGKKSGDDDDDEWSNSSGGGGAVFDLDSGDALWLAQKGSKWMVLYTYKGDAWVGIDVRDTPKAPMEGQYTGSRIGTVADGYTLEFECRNPSISPSCKEFGLTMKLSCTAASGPQLVCGSMVFNKVTSQDIDQDP